MTMAAYVSNNMVSPVRCLSGVIGTVGSVWVVLSRVLDIRKKMLCLYIRIRALGDL